MNAQDKKIGLFSAIIIQTNAMIGAGVVAIPAILAQTTGSIGLLTYVLCIVIILCMTFSLGELSVLHGGHAWCYRFPAMLGKHSLGMIVSSCYVFGVLIAMGFVAKQAGIWLHETISFLSAGTLSLLTVGILSIFVYLGKNVSSFWQFVYSSVIFLGILVTSGVCFDHFDQELFFRSFDGNPVSILMITPVLLFSFLGFESISSLYAIVKNPRRNVFIGGIIGVISVGILYMVFSTSVIGAISPDYFLDSKEQSLAIVLAKAFPRFQFISKILYLGGLFAIIGTLHSMIWSVSVLICDVFEKSKNGKIQLFMQKGNKGADYAVLFSTLAIIFSAVLLTSTTIMNISVLLIAISYTLSIMALFTVKKHRLMNRIVCIMGVVGGCLMGVFSIYSLLNPSF